MRPLPNLDDVSAMTARGRRSCLMSARNEALEELRDVYTHLQSEDISSMRQLASQAIACCERIMDISSKWVEYEANARTS